MIWGGGEWRFSSSPGITLLAALASPFALRRGGDRKIRGDR